MMEKAIENGFAIVESCSKLLVERRVMELCMSGHCPVS